ncbi:hypothetical protein OROHE_011486 [Orobanche hederae]
MNASGVKGGRAFLVSRRAYRMQCGIHGGGMDHENEIAQNCGSCQCHALKVILTSYWIHNEFVTIDFEKMSKSLGNVFTLRQVLELYHPLALRLFLMGTHHRSSSNYSDLLLESASDHDPKENFNGTRTRDL